METKDGNRHSILMFPKVGKHELGIYGNLLPNNKGVEAVKLLCECLKITTYSWNL